MPWSSGADARTAMNAFHAALIHECRIAEVIVADYRDKGSPSKGLVLLDPPSGSNDPVCESDPVPDIIKVVSDGDSRFAETHRNQGFLVTESSESATLALRSFLEKQGLSSIAWFRQDIGTGTLILVLGFRESQDFETVARGLVHRVDQAILALRYGVWPIHSAEGLSRLTCDIVDELQDATTLNDVVRRMLYRLSERVAMLDNDAVVSIWLADFRAQRLRCEPSFIAGRNGSELVGGELAFGEVDGELSFGENVEGLIGWSATTQLTVNSLVHSATETLPDSDNLVRETYRPIWSDDRTESQLVVPMIYQGRRVGVMSVESPRAERFAQEVVLLARILTAHGAQAIHQQQLHDFYQEALSIDDVDQLMSFVVSRLGNFMESPHAAVFLWEPERHRLKLAAKSSEIYNADGRPIAIGETLYPRPGIGLTRWVFDHQMSLNVRDVQLPENRDDDQWGEIREQVRQQWQATHAPLSDVTVTDSRKAGDDRVFWALHIDDADVAADEIPQPVWSNSQMEELLNPTSAIFVPIPHPQNSTAALGVLRFSRRTGSRSFSDYERERLQSVASRLGQVLARKQQEEKDRWERELLSEMLRQVPGEWEEHFPGRLLPTLRTIYEGTGANVVVLRMEVDGELHHVASYPSESDIQQQHPDLKLQIPKCVFTGNGGTGHAVSEKRTVYLADRSHPLQTRSRAEFKNTGPEGVFADVIGSEVAVPLRSGTEIVGAIAAISFVESSHSVNWKDGHWEATETGIQLHHSHLLQYHASWLGPALHFVREVSDGQRHAASLTTALNHLAADLDAKGAMPALDEKLRIFCTTTIPRIAAHPHGLNIPQVLLARCEGSVTAEGQQTTGTWNITGVAGHVFGATCRAEQDEIRDCPMSEYVRDGLLNDAWDDSLRRTWQDFAAKLTQIPEAPVVVTTRRENAVDCHQICLDELPESEVRRQWREFLGALVQTFCGKFDEDFESQLAVGLTPLDVPGTDRDVRYMLIFTKKRFERSVESPEKIRSRPLRRDMLDSLNDLCDVARLATFVAERFQLRDRVDKLDGQLPSLVHRLLEPVRMLSTSLLRGRKLRERLNESLSPFKVLTGEFETAWREFEAVQDELDVQTELARQLLLSKRQTVRALLGNLKGGATESQTFAVRDVVDIPSELFRAYAGVNGIQFDYCVDGQCLDMGMSGHVEDLQSVVVTLLHNAVHAATQLVGSTEQPRWVRLSVSSEPVAGEKHRIQIHVSDNGIPVKDEAGLFKPLNSTWDGDGMGLAGSFAIVESHRGLLRFERVPEKTFVLELEATVPKDKKESRPETTSGLTSDVRTRATRG